MVYRYDLSKLAAMEKSDGSGMPYEYIHAYGNFALAERIETLVDQLVIMNTRLGLLDGNVTAKMNELVKATKEKGIAP